LIPKICTSRLSLQVIERYDARLVSNGA
jgi:hypothetical protein